MTKKFREWLRTKAWLNWGDYQAAINGPWADIAVINEKFLERLLDKADEEFRAIPEDFEPAAVAYIKLLQSTRKPVRATRKAPRTAPKRNPRKRALSSKERVILRVLAKDLEDIGFPLVSDIEDFIDNDDITPVAWLRLVKKDVGPYGHGWHNVGPGYKPDFDEFWRREKGEFSSKAEAREVFKNTLEDWQTEAEPYYEAAKLVDAAINRLLAKD